MDAAIPPPPPADTAPSVTSSIERKLSPGVVLLIAILAMVFFIIGLLNLLVQNLLRLRRARRRRRQVGDAVASPTAFQGQLGELFHLHDAGVDQASIDALPVFPYHAVAAAGGDSGKGPFDCAVCLCEFAGDDKLRLLPTCGHAFHVPCIDAWLLSHSTCPLCRGSILDAFADAECSPPSSPSALLALHSESIREMVAAGGRGDPADRDDEEAPPHKDAEEIVEVKLGKLRCVDGNAASARDLAATGNGSRGSLGQRRCLSMGSYEYVMDEHAALRVAVKAPKTRAASSTSRRRHALSACDFGGSSKKGAWETAVTEAAAAGRCSGGSAASLKRDSFSTSKIWMVPAAARREEGSRRAAEPAVVRRAASFRWPAMSAGGKKQHRGGGGEASWDVEAAGGGGRGDGGAPAPAEERPSLARAAMIWVAGGRQGSHS